ncbi:hypothetical protein AA12717_3990 [Gluconacetobacter sacchari DSM 12717]|uniref:Uncharacterized protein n=1 Tax=Gluconacetobacter sacchari DSM 12717 TaxID=1307940 RepID=A0ABQ0PCY2_9PROT|nr:hypothetical protein AA12717_3990 [Gluconacetobacter sacchari DSM 12717]
MRETGDQRPFGLEALGEDFYRGTYARYMAHLPVGQQPEIGRKRVHRRCEAMQPRCPLAHETRKIAAAHAGGDRLRQTHHRIHAGGDARDRHRRGHMAPDRHRRHSLAGRNERAACKVVARQAVERPGDGGDSSAHKCIGRGVGCTHRDVGVTTREVGFGVVDGYVEPYAGQRRAAGGERGHDEPGEKRIARRQPHFARRLHVLPGQREGKRVEILRHPPGQRYDRLSRGRGDVAIAMALEDGPSGAGLELFEPAEHGRVVHAEPECGSGQAPLARDGIEQAQIVPVRDPVRHVHRPFSCLRPPQARDCMNAIWLFWK